MTIGAAGVSRTLTKDRRGKPVVSYLATVKVIGKHMRMKYTAGRVGAVTVEQEAFTLDVAVRCRQAYERAHDRGQAFDGRRWRGWKKRYGVPATPEQKVPKAS